MKNYFKVSGEHLYFFDEDESIYQAFELAEQAASTLESDVWVYRRITHVKGYEDLPIIGYRNPQEIIQDIQMCADPTERREYELEYAHAVLAQ